MKTVLALFALGATCVLGDELADLRAEVDALKREFVELRNNRIGNSGQMPSGYFTNVQEYASSLNVESPVDTNRFRRIGTSTDDRVRSGRPNSPPYILCEGHLVVLDSNVKDIPKGSVFKNQANSPFSLSRGRNSGNNNFYFCGFTLCPHPLQELSRTTAIGEPVRKCALRLFQNSDVLPGTKNCFSSESVDPMGQASWSDFSFPIRLTNGTSFIEISAPVAKIVEESKQQPETAD